MNFLNMDAIKEITFQPWELEKYRAKKDRSFEIANKHGGGIYRMYDAADQIIYVGKSNDIHRRLLQHIGGRSNTHYFVEEVVKIEFHQNNDPVMQTLLESIFIYANEPKYNDEIKDRRKMQ